MLWCIKAYILITECQKIKKTVKASVVDAGWIQIQEHNKDKLFVGSAEETDKVEKRKENEIK